MTKVNKAQTMELVGVGMDPVSHSFSHWALHTQMVPVLISQPGSPSKSSGSRGKDRQTRNKIVNEKSNCSIGKEQGTTTKS